MIAPPSTRLTFRAWLCLAAILVALIGGAFWMWRPRPTHPASSPRAEFPVSTVDSTRGIDGALAAEWSKAGIEPLPRADDLAIVRRLSLALTGAVPSLEDIRAFESLPENLRIERWTAALLDDSRFADYVAERFARAYVGVEGGPFLVYRRSALVRWISGQIQSGRPYDAMVRDLIAAEGLWTTNPAANFITASIDNNNEKEGPDQIKLAIRTTRAFLGVRIDCVQCHDDPFGERWKQADFHRLAAYYAGAEMKFTGVRDDRKKVHEVRYRGETDEHAVLPETPFFPHLLPAKGRPRERLSAWVTHPENLPFARATANRVWAILFGKALVEPIDDIPIEASQVPPVLDLLARDFVEHRFDLKRLFATLSATRAFQLDSRSPDPARPVTAVQEAHWAAFPLTRLRPEQVAGSLVQSTFLGTLDADSPFLLRLAKFDQSREFVSRFGDLGEGEFENPGGTIPQRLLMMNGKLIKERTEPNPLIGAPTRIANLAADPSATIEVAYLCVLTRRPTDAERDHFAARFATGGKAARQQPIEDLFWTLLNSTEFSWNH